MAGEVFYSINKLMTQGRTRLFQRASKRSGIAADISVRRHAILQALLPRFYALIRQAHVSEGEGSSQPETWQTILARLSYQGLPAFAQAVRYHDTYMSTHTAVPTMMHAPSSTHEMSSRERLKVMQACTLEKGHTRHGSASKGSVRDVTMVEASRVSSRQRTTKTQDGTPMSSYGLPLKVVEARQEELMLLWPEAFSKEALSGFVAQYPGHSFYDAGLISWYGYKQKRAALRRKTLRLSAWTIQALQGCGQGHTLLRQLSKPPSTLGDTQPKAWLDPLHLKPLLSRAQFLRVLETLCTEALRTPKHWQAWLPQHEHDALCQDLQTLLVLLQSQQGWIEVIEPSMIHQSFVTHDTQEVFYTVLWFPYNPWHRAYLRSVRGRPPLHWNASWQYLMHLAVQHTPVPLPPENIPMCFLVPTFGTIQGYSMLQYSRQFTPNASKFMHPLPQRVVSCGKTWFKQREALY
ncbi:MAG: hypothetical protein ACKO37_05335 [Vampirovibrionales bacterium]